ncbi:type IV secretion system DNA-binding domain-containing protein [Candidatus Parcubacteria bacterium]|nr:type IV secretion system DNA-binding domain-containing protein [Candidatus Parcubacteria bacterium]
MFNDDITVFAETTFRNKNQKFGIKIDDRRRHMYLIGKTGMGKSTVLENMIIGDIRAGKGVAIVDPHGDLAEKVIEYIPTDRINDVVYFNPADMENPIAFNVVEHVAPHLRHLVASGLLGVFQKLWADSWGPRLEYILRNSILAVLDYPGSTLLAVTRMLSDKKFRKKVIDKIQDPVVKAFWVNEFAGYNDKFASEAVSPIQNKVGQFLSSSLIRNIVGQVKSSIDMRKIMDEGKILIMNLSKGRIGEDNSRLLGAMMITKIQLAAMSRVDVDESERKDFYLYVDEFQNFATDSFANILSEARKYRLNLVLAHQYVEQVEEKVRNAIFGNVGTLIVFRVGAADAEWVVPEFTPTFTEEDIVNLPKYEVYLKLMIDGIASEPFSARGLPPLSDSEKTGNTQKVISVCRERYAKPREVVEDKINRWHEDGGKDEEEYDNRNSKTQNNNIKNIGETDNKKNNSSISPVAKNLDNSVYKHEAKCSRCGKDTKISFKPDGIRPIYCRDCLTIIREEKKQELENRKELKSRELKKIKNKSEDAVMQDVSTISLKDALSKPPVKFKAGSRRQFNKSQKPKTNILGEGEEVVF